MEFLLTQVSITVQVIPMHALWSGAGNVTQVSTHTVLSAAGLTLRLEVLVTQSRVVQRGD